MPIYMSSLIRHTEVNSTTSKGEDHDRKANNPCRAACLRHFRSRCRLLRGQLPRGVPGMSKLPTRIWRNRLFCAHCSFEVFDSRAYCLNPRCVAFMPEGHNRQQESAHIKPTSPDLPIPRPRTHPEPKHPQNSSQRFLRRFSAPSTLSTPKTLSRAMKNRLLTASQPLVPLFPCSGPSIRCFSPSFPSLPCPATCSNLNPKHQPKIQNLSFPLAYVPSPKVAGVFSSPSSASAFRFVRWVMLWGS